MDRSQIDLSDQNKPAKFIAEKGKIAEAGFITAEPFMYEHEIKEFTGISDPYEEPANPELRIQTEGYDVDHAAHQVLLKLEQMGLIGLQ